MSKTATRQTEKAEEVKTPVTRLMDLLAGWSAYVSEDEENGIMDPLVTAEKIGALYQSAGELEPADNAAQIAAVYEYMLRIVGDLLVSGFHTPLTRSDDSEEAVQRYSVEAGDSKDRDSRGYPGAALGVDKNSLICLDSDAENGLK